MPQHPSFAAGDFELPSLYFTVSEAQNYTDFPKQLKKSTMKFPIFWPIHHQ